MTALSRLRLELPPLHSDFMAAIPVDPREELERLERKHAENPEGRYFVPLADAYRRSGDLSGAIDLLRAGLARHPDYLSAHVVLGRCYADSGETEAAEAEFRHVLTLDPQNLIALGTLGDIALADGRRREAERWYQDLLAVDPMNDDARAALSRLRDEATGVPGDPEERVDDRDGAGERQTPAGPGFTQSVPEMYQPEDGVGDMDLRSDDDRGAFFDDDADVVVTETIAELYTRQGFFDRAADVYRELIRRRGGDGALEARLRRVESLAAGLPDTGSAETSRDEVPGDVVETSAQDAMSPEAPEDEVTAGDVVDPFYPLIGPVGEQEVGSPAGSSAGDEAELPLPPAYDFATPERGAAGEAGTASDDLEDLLIDPYSDPFAPPGPTDSADLSARSFGASGGESTASAGAGFGDGLVQDPFADSFAEGFPTLDDVDDEALPDGGALPIVGITNLVEEDALAASSTEGVTIGAFLKSLAGWRRSATAGETGRPNSVPEPSGALPPVSAAQPKRDEPQLPAAEGAADPERTSPGDGSSELAGADVFGAEAEEQAGSGTGDTTPGWDLADIEFDSALGHVPADAGLGRLPEVAPAEPSGADDLQLVSGTDDLFPWEIPVPEPAAQTLPPVQPLDLDPGYPFDDPPVVEAPSVDGTVHSERTPSEAVEPEQPSEAFRPEGEAASSAPEGVIPESGMPYDPDEDMGITPPSPPADTQDDDDLESFQAWLRSLKR